MAVRVGIIGYGSMGIWHAGRASSLPGFRLHSVCDITPRQRQAAEKSYGCRTFANLGDFLDDDELDLVVVATPSHGHEAPTIAALRAGKHVLCEKPLARTEAEGRRMFAAAAKAGRTLMAFQNRRFDEDFLTTRAAVESGRLGRLYDIRLIRWTFTRLMQTFGVASYRPGWRSEAAFGGGALLDFGAHYLDQLFQLQPTPITCVFADLRGRRWTHDADDQFVLLLRFGDEVAAQVEYSQTAHVPIDVEWAINGERGGYRYEKERSIFYSRTRTGREKLLRVKNTPGDWDALYRNFRAVIERGAPPAIQPAETLRVLRVFDAARRSARLGQAVSIRDEYAPQR